MDAPLVSEYFGRKRIFTQFQSIPDDTLIKEGIVILQWRSLPDTTLTKWPTATLLIP